jgi:hypothetical protein
MNSVERIKTLALYRGILEQARTLPNLRDRDYLEAKAALMRLGLNRPELASFAREIFGRARNNPTELKRFAYLLQLNA